MLDMDVDLESYLPENTPKHLLKRIVVVPEQQRFQDDFKAPTKYFVIDCFGNACHIRTRSRTKAQEIANEIWGEGFYTVRQVVIAQAH